MDHVKGPLLAIGFVFKFFGWQAYFFANTFSVKVAGMASDPDLIEHYSNMMGLLADGGAVLAFIISSTYYIDKWCRGRKK